MSSRVLKKLHGEPDLEIKEQDELLSDIENDIGNGTKKKQLNINRYDLVRGLCNYWREPSVERKYTGRSVWVGYDWVAFAFVSEYFTQHTSETSYKLFNISILP